jgi:FtsP/CotA-like multicopper oxidase with cupredoxin domain
MSRTSLEDENLLTLLRHNAPAGKRVSPLVSRRVLLKASARAAAAAAMGGVPFIASSPSYGRGTTVNVNLSVEIATISGRECRTYNGVVPGPTISAAPGESIDVHLVNNLPMVNDDCPEHHNHNMRHGLNTTNLHTHGLHVSPYKDSTGRFDSDNVFLKVVPKDQEVACWDDESFRRHETNYRFELPRDHPPGTHWYHPHKHGSTNLQVMGGMAGPLIIRDPAGWMPPYIKKANERTFMLMQAGAVLVDPNGGGMQPTITLRPGAVERWRIINANPSGTAFVSLAVESGDIELWQIAFDGLTLPQRVLISPSNKEPWENPASLAPGNRMDLMVRVKQSAPSGPVVLRAVPGSIEFLHSEADHGLALAATEVQIVINIDGDPVDDEWSEEQRTLPGPGLEPLEPTSQRTVTFKEIEVDGAPTPTIDGKLYDGTVEQSMKLGTTEQWTVINETKRTHPFHIHVNPFFVTHINGTELQADSPLRRWQDTIALPPQRDGTPGSVIFRTRFADFAGAFVIHCHILAHEDGGMMQKVEVV